MMMMMMHDDDCMMVYDDGWMMMALRWKMGITADDCDVGTLMAW